MLNVHTHFLVLDVPLVVAIYLKILSIVSLVVLSKVKTEQNIPGLGGKKNLCLKVDLKLGVLTISKPGEAGSTYQPYQGM